MGESGPKHPSGQAEQNPPPASKPAWPSRFGRGIAVTRREVNTSANGIIAVLTVVLALTAWYQWQAAEQSLELTREQVHKGQRAYLILHRAVLVEPPTAGKTPHATIDLSNNGQTPAIDVTYDLGLAVMPGCPTTINYGAARPAGAIGAGQTLKLEALMLKQLQPSDVEEITADAYTVSGTIITVSNRPNLVLFGVVRYRDVFGGIGETEFSAAYFKRENGFRGCPTHNGMK